MISLPMANKIHSIERNDVLHFDFCYMIEGKNKIQYVLILMDYFSVYVCSFLKVESKPEVTAESLPKWFTAIGVVQKWISDRGKHFKN